MKIKNSFMVMFFLQIVMLSNLAFAQSSNKLNPSLRTETIKKLSEMINDLYVIPDLAAKMANQLIVNLQNGKYDTIDDFNQLGRVLTDDLFQIAHDRHLRIYYDPARVSIIKKLEQSSEEERKQVWLKDKEDKSKTNFGFKEIKLLPGNIGYLCLTTMERLDQAGETASAAMNLLSNSDFLIIDLRNNNGGWSSMVQYLASYFYKESDDILLFQIHYRKNNEVVQFRSLPYLQGKRVDNTPLYILINGNTMSAAENFAYSLQKLGRAVIIGEKSNFGAHSTGGPRIMNDYYMIQLPIAENINPITKTNWEESGVEPDIKTESRDALDKTIEIILDNIIEKNRDEIFLNNLGYLFLGEDQISSAIKVLIKNTNLYPQSFNAYDSLAEAYMLAGNKELAIKNYEKSLELNPGNTNAVEQLKTLMNNK